MLLMKRVFPEGLVLPLPPLCLLGQNLNISVSPPPSWYAVCAAAAPADLRRGICPLKAPLSLSVT